MNVHFNELDPPFEILEPAEIRGPVAFSSPHSGCVYPRAFLAAARLDLAILRRSEDCFVDELLVGVVPRGHPLMRAHFPRCFVDVNREPYELDPRMFDGRLPSFANTRSMRVAGGLGTVARVVGDAQEIYDDRKSTRLNSSHANISYAVFCLEKEEIRQLHRMYLVLETLHL